MSNQETEILLKINQTEKELSELKKKLSEERLKLKDSEPFYALSKDEEIYKTFTKISHALEYANIFIDFDIRRGGEYKNKGFYLGHGICPWEIVKDSLDVFVLVPKDILQKENILTK